MIYLFLGAILMTAVGITSFHMGDRSYSWGATALAVIGVFATGIGVIGLVVSAIAGFEWHGASVKAELINREYGTKYTQSEVFYASSVIDLIRDLDRKRVEVNGDVFRDRDPQRNEYKSDQ